MDDKLFSDVASAHLGNMTSQLEKLMATARNEVAAAIEKIDIKTRERITSVCMELGASDRVQRDVLFCFCCLAEFERDLKKQIKTPAERRENLERVEHLATELLAALLEMDLSDSLAIHQKRKPTEPDEGNCEYEKSDFQTVVVQEFGRLLDRAEHLLPFSRSDFLRQVGELSSAAKGRRIDLSDDGATGGRRSVLKHYAKHVSRLWDAVNETGINPGRGGDFERLCNVLFEEADVHAKAEGAIRHFVENILPKPKNKVVPLFGSSPFFAEIPEETTTEGDRKNPAQKRPE